MNINSIGPSKVINSYNNNKKVQTKEVAATKSDSVEISAAGKNLVSFLGEDIINSPEKVEAVKRAVAQGTYKPSSEAIARRMVAAIKGSEI
jgi:negative regulator of flagellin synthesis FlgM